MRLLLALLSLGLVVSLSACNTFEGLGQDIQKGGENISHAAEKSK